MAEENEKKEKSPLVLTPQMGFWDRQGLQGYDYNARTNCVRINWEWSPITQWIGLN